VTIAQSTDLNVAKKLKEDREFRHAFFIAESSAKIAQQLIDLRKRRVLNQTELAELIETGQPAISRVESADYSNWSFNTLRRLAEALDARLRVIIEASEDVIPEYEAQEQSSRLGQTETKSRTNITGWKYIDLIDAGTSGTMVR
jgi:transcriptional regulator with XRE-family HTH domain